MPKPSFAAALSAGLNPPKIDAYKVLGYEPACVPYIAGQIPAPCGQCPQEQFATATEYSVMLGGSAGGGKSLSLLMYAIKCCIEHPGIRVGAFRRSYPELRESLLAELAQYGYCDALSASWNGGEHELRFPNGSVIMFRYAETLQDATRRQGGQYQLVALDERCLFPPDVVSFLESRIRTGRAHIPVVGSRSTANPGGPGHAAVRKEFIDSTAYGQRVVTDVRGRTVRFIPAGLKHNPYIDPQYAADLRALPEKLRSAFLDGNWDAFAGQVFPELDRERHVVRPFAIPASWPRYAGIDWGYTAPWAVIWVAQCPDGRLWAYRELYETQVGETEQARRILEAEGDEHVQRWIDDACFATRGEAKSIAQTYLDAGCAVTAAGKGAGSRVAGWTRIHSYLAEAPACPMHREAGWTTCPMLHMFSTCEHLWTELSSLPHASSSGANPEDADTKAPDHISDALRYLTAGLGMGPSFPIFDIAPGDGGLNAYGVEVMVPLGQWAMRVDPHDAWASASRTEDEERPAAGSVQQSPFR